MSDWYSFEIIPADMQIDGFGDASERAFLDAIADRVAWFLEHDMDMLMSYLYRLDVAEHLINEALMPFSEEAPNQALAKLIVNRQKQRIATKGKYKVTPIEGWEF